MFISQWREGRVHSAWWVVQGALCLYLERRVPAIFGIEFIIITRMITASWRISDL
jgi:hypothetical protein